MNSTLQQHWSYLFVGDLLHKRAVNEVDGHIADLSSLAISTWSKAKKSACSRAS